MVDRIRNAFVVTPEGEVVERAYPPRWAALVHDLERLRNDLKNSNDGVST